MANPYFRFKQFTVMQDRCAMKVSTDGCLFGAWVASELAGKANADSRILDIGTGTGLLSLMIAQKAAARIYGIEIEPEAAYQAAENTQNSPWKDRIEIKAANILDIKEGRFDFIICNPPFYEQQLEGSSGKRNIAHHSKELKLKSLVMQIRNLLKSNGYFFLLLPWRRQGEAIEMIHSAGLHIMDTVQILPVHGAQPIRCMIRGSAEDVQRISQHRICIRDEMGNYSEEFISLLRDYYLYL